jgi:hypothetical protein
MRGLGRLCIGVGVAAFFLLGWARARPGGWGGPAGEIGQLPDILLQICAEEQLSAELEDKAAALHRADDTKLDIAREVLAGRMTLAQAVESFQEIHEHLPLAWEVMRDHYPGKTDKERWSRNLISWIRSEAEDHPDQQEKLALLDRDLEQFLEQSEP